MIRILCILLSILFFGGCHQSDSSIFAGRSFIIPTVINSSISDSKIGGYKSDKQVIDFNLVPFVGKFSFQDTIDINGEAWFERVQNDIIYDNLASSVEDSLEVNGLELYLDYSQTVYHSFFGDSCILPFYPLFLVNSTPTSKIFLGKDLKAFGDQEAYSTHNYSWKALGNPEECVSWCGNGHMCVIINPEEFIVLLIRKYSGDYRPELRVSIKNGSSTLVSRTFIGNINEELYTILNNIDQQ